MATGSNTNQIIKLVLTACISVIVTGATTWFAFGQGVVDRDYLEHYDKNYSTWAKDKDIISEKLNNIDCQNKEALNLIQNLKSTVDDMRFQQKVLTDELKKHADDK